MKQIIAFLLVFIMSCCPKPVTPPVNYQDEQETPEEVAQAKKGNTACVRAGKRLAALKCPEASADFAKLCQQLVDSGQPICPTKLARIKSCAEVDTICR